MNRTARAKRQAQLLAAGLALPVLLAGFLIFTMQATRPSGAQMLETALSRLEQQQEYDLMIVEKAPRYELSFRGRVEGSGELKGVLPDYNLEIIFREGLLRLRRKETSEWVKADTLGLHGLAGFLTTPLELLQSKTDCFSRALPGEKITLGRSSCHTLYFAVSNPEKFVQRLFPKIDYNSISEVTVGAALAEPDLSLKQLRILLEFDNHGDEQIERCYYLNH